MIVNLSKVISELESGSRPKGGVKDGVGSIASLGAEHLESNGGFNFKKVKYVPDEFFRSQSKGIIRSNDILIVKDGATTAKVSFVDDNFPFKEASINEHLFRIKVNTELAIPKFVFWYLFSNYGKDQVLSDFRGATVGGISRAFVDKTQIPLYSLNEQKRMVKLLDRADAFRQKRKQAIDLLDEYLKSVFLEMFGNISFNPHGFNIGKIADLVSEVKYGTSAPAIEKGKYPYLRMNNITYSGEMDISNLKYIDLAEKDEGKYLAREGDLLFNRTNSKELVGKTAVYNFTIPMAIAGYLIRVRTNEKALPEYISGYLNSLHGKQTLMAMCKSIIGMANINAKELQSIKILMPPVNLQEEYSKKIKKVHNLKQKMLNQSEELDNQFQALMQKLFS
ncbi:restriction endonuclease [Candidatus Peregrinibacteria bacterium CG10_big_fil_rev_8_21_14_0_10_36_19]|nr:MAG: restriction endonuclease [Candidatus Peregrinibacteria bacterium CG10_big_fil_rev_8_21_14_0_10_36_19]